LARKNKNKTTINYHLIAVNVGIIGSLFIFFIIALEDSASTILGVQTKKWLHNIQSWLEPY